MKVNLFIVQDSLPTEQILERINEGLTRRKLTADNVISIVYANNMIEVWFKEPMKEV